MRGSRNRPWLVTPTSITTWLQLSKSTISLFWAMSSKSKNKWEYMLFSTLGNRGSWDFPSSILVPGSTAPSTKASGPPPAMISVRRWVSSASRSSVREGRTSSSYSVSTPMAER